MLQCRLNLEHLIQSEAPRGAANVGHREGSRLRELGPCAWGYCVEGAGVHISAALICGLPPLLNILTSCRSLGLCKTIWYTSKVKMFNGRSAHFLFVSRTDNLRSLLETTLPGLGYDLVDLELSGGGLVRLFIDKPEGITVDDCALVSNHLTRLFGAESVDYGRLEVSSPGLDRPLRRPQDFKRFEGERAQVKMRVPVGGRKNFTGVLRGVSDAEIRMEVDGALVSLALSQVDKARLVPNL